MFFPNLITKINEHDKVLEIGPGATPHPRSDEFLEYRFETDEELVRQSGNVGLIETDKPVHYYTGEIFPFPDNSFDYVICSHVLEHVPDPVKFVKELTRISKRGYIEFPLATYEYLFNIPEHLHLIMCENMHIKILEKSACSLNEFVAITDFMRKTLENGFSELQTLLPEYFFCGFEWKDTIVIDVVSNMSELDFQSSEIPTRRARTIPSNENMSSKFFRKLVRKIDKKLVQKVKF